MIHTVPVAEKSKLDLLLFSSSFCDPELDPVLPYVGARVVTNQKEDKY